MTTVQLPNPAWNGTHDLFRLYLAGTLALATLFARADSTRRSLAQPSDSGHHGA